MTGNAWHPSLFRRLFGAVALVLALGAVLLIWLARDYAVRSADEAYDRILTGAALQIAENVLPGEAGLEADIPVSALDLLSVFRQERVFYRVIDVEGKTLTGYEDLPVSAETLSALARGGGRQGDRLEIWEQPYRGGAIRFAALLHPLVQEGAPSHAVIVVGHSTGVRRALADRLTLQVSLVVGVMSVLALLGSALAARYALNPLRRIGQALNRRDPNDLTPLNVYTPREIEGLVQAINHFMSRLAHRLDAIQNMISDAAHQIKTPVSALVAQLEMARTETRPEDVQRHIERASQRASQLGRLASQLLSQAAIAHRAEARKRVGFDLADVVRQAAVDSIPHGLERDITVSATGLEKPVMMLGDPLSLGEAVKNLIDNAVRHGATHILQIRLEHTVSSIVLIIADDGPGIDPALLPHVTKRFVRGTSVENGSGLGLAIVSDVAQQHGAHLELGHNDIGFFEARLVFAIREVAL
jgi:two-component system sensor histidine kinase TctE